VSRLAGPYGHPLHPILVTVPIGAWVASFVSAVALGVLTVSGWLGGQLAYRYGVRVAEESTQAEAYQ